MRLDEARLCTLVMVGVRADGSKKLVAVADGHRESTESWADLLRDCKRRGMRAPVLAVGDGALGFWAALREVFPATKEQRCWVHKVANVLNCLPKSAQPAARRALAEIRDAEGRGHADQPDRYLQPYVGCLCRPARGFERLGPSSWRGCLLHRPVRRRCGGARARTAGAVTCLRGGVVDRSR